MDAFKTSLMVGFLLGALSVWLTNFINGQFARQEKKISFLILKRARRD
jgi:hypothetical protein